jgi:ASPIC and UnbV
MAAASQRRAGHDRHRPVPPRAQPVGRARGGAAGGGVPGAAAARGGDCARSAPFALYRNTRAEDGGAAHHWIGLALEGNGTTCNREAAGTRVALTYVDRETPVEQVQEVTITNAFSAQGDRRLHFGLGGYDGPVAITVGWCGAAPVSIGPLPSGRYHSIRQPR